MDTADEFQQRWQRERQLGERLRLAAFRLAAAEIERVWAVLSAHQQGLPIRQIAAAVGLSRARVHQLLGAPAAADVPAQLSRLREQGWPVTVPDVGEVATDPVGGDRREDLLSGRLAEEVTALRESIEWLERLDRGEPVVVNLLPDCHGGRDFVAFDRARVLRVLRRIASDLDELSRVPHAAPAPARPPRADPAERRRRLAEPPSTPPRLNAREERAALRAAAGLDPLP